MNIKELAEWQWGIYETNHQSKTNLVIHIVAVPWFISALFSFVGAFMSLHIGAALFSVIIMALSLGVQAYGHGKETHQPAPFSSSFDAVSRILLEQCFTFPRFVVTGKWFVALRNAD